VLRASWLAVLRWFAPLLLVSSLLAPAAYAQKDATPTKTERMPPAPQYALAIVSVLVVLLIVCMPSRKV
jgi:hypothetical protein